MCQRMVRRECINLDSVDEGGEGEEGNNGPDRMMERKRKNLPTEKKRNENGWHEPIELLTRIVIID